MAGLPSIHFAGLNVGPWIATIEGLGGLIVQVTMRNGDTHTGELLGDGAGGGMIQLHPLGQDGAVNTDHVTVLLTSVVESILVL